MKKYYSPIILFAFCAVCFTGCYKPIDDVVVTGIDKNEGKGTVKIYFAIEAVFEANGVDLSDVEDFVIMWRKSETELASIETASKDHRGCYIEVPMLTGILVDLGFHIKNTSDVIAWPVAKYGSQFDCDSSLCIPISEM